jgi:hypothetical protein
VQFDLVGIAGGFAGLCAALRGAELGLCTAVLEAGADDNYRCSSRWAGGIFYVSYHDVKSNPDKPANGWRSRPGTGGGNRRRCRPHRRLARAPRSRIHASQRDPLAPFHVGAAAGAGCRAGLARPRPGPAARGIAPTARRAAGPGAARRQGRLVAVRAWSGRRRHGE